MPPQYVMQRTLPSTVILWSCRGEFLFLFLILHKSGQTHHHPQNVFPELFPILQNRQSSQDLHSSQRHLHILSECPHLMGDNNYLLQFSELHQNTDNSDIPSLPLWFLFYLLQNLRLLRNPVQVRLHKVS